VRAVAAVRAVTAMGAVAPVTAVAPMAAVAPVAAMRRVGQMLREQDVLAVGFGPERLGRLRGVERRVRVQCLAGFLATEEIHRRLLQYRQPLLFVAHVGSFLLSSLCPAPVTATCRPPPARRAPRSARRAHDAAGAPRGPGPPSWLRWPPPRARA